MVLKGNHQENLPCGGFRVATNKDTPVHVELTVGKGTRNLSQALPNACFFFFPARAEVEGGAFEDQGAPDVVELDAPESYEAVTLKAAWTPGTDADSRDGAPQKRPANAFGVLQRLVWGFSERKPPFGDGSLCCFLEPFRDGCEDVTME